MRLRSVILVLALLLTAPAAWANPIGVVTESARTAGHAARNGSLTVGRTVRDFFTHGPRTAGRTWKRNAGYTHAQAKADGTRVKAEAHDER